MTDQDQVTTTDEELRAKQRKKQYKKSLNLPKTGFPMKANLRQNEAQSIKQWEEMGLYAKLQEAREGAEVFSFHDGPPYANGNIHVGHLLNKTLKDLVVRTQAMAGRHCPYIPGWDCHGLPIEHKVMTEMVESGKAEKIKGLPEETQRMAVRKACHAYAQKFKTVQASQMQRLLTLADYDDPYLTMEPRFEKGVLEVFAAMLEQGIVYRDLKPVHWSIANETALAEAELEYMNRLDPSIYVWFEAEDKEAVAAAFAVESLAIEGQPGFMIWTTTPWTLPANLLIAVHPRSEYSLVNIDGRCGVVAKELVETVAKAKGLDPGSVEILSSVKGSELGGLHYRHPLGASAPDVEKSSVFKLVEADYVTLEDGTGLVHTAPGHGADDYQTGLREGAPIYCPVQGDGTYDETVPEWLRTLSIWDANPKIIEALSNSGHLFHHFEFEHSYPHDWRSKTPVVFRATEQWFIAVDQARKDGGSLRGMALDETENKIQFVPGWGQKRLKGMLDSRPDWCISRQRSWGLPIPAFETPSGEAFLTAASTRAVASCFANGGGSDEWFTEGPETLLASYEPQNDPQAPAELQSGELAIADLRKRFDIFDVWFESGSSWNSVLRQRDQKFPADLYLEGSDQHRGWFQSSLLCSLAATGQSPFEAVLTHGFTIDKDGRKMSKSGGNALDILDLFEDFGADVCRWWVSSLAFENDIKVDRSFFDLAGESYRKIRNTLRFVLSNLHDFTSADAVDLSQLSPNSLDAWLLGEAADLRSSVIRSYLSYDFRRAHLKLFDFCNETLSAIYLDANKDRLYCDAPDSERRRAAQTAMAEVGHLLVTLLAPILPHTADEAYRALLEKTDPSGNSETTKESVHLATYAEISPVDASSLWPELLELRHRVKGTLERAKATGLENTLDAGVELSSPLDLEPFQEDLPDLFGVSRLTITKGEQESIDIVDLRSEPRCERSWKRDETVALRDDGGWLSERDFQAVAANED